MKRISVLYVFICALFTSPVTFSNNTLTAAWHTLVEQNPGLQAGIFQLQAEQSALHNAQGRRLPSLSVAGRWNSLDEEVGMWFDTSALFPGGEPIYMPVQKQNFWNAQLQLTLPLYTGGAITAGIDAEKANVKTQQASLQQVKDDLFITFVERFLSVGLAQQKEGIQQQLLANLEQHLNGAIRRYQEGTISLTEQLQSQVERDKAYRNLLQAQVDAKLSWSAYRSLFSKEASRPAIELSFQPLPTMNPTALVEQAFVQSALIKQISAGKSKASAGLANAKANYFPKVAAFAHYELFPDDLTQTDPQWAAGIAFEWSILGAGKKSAQVAQYRQLMNAAEQKDNQARLGIAVLVEQALFAIESAHQNYTTTLSSQALAEENLRLQSRAYEQGLKTSLDKIDAQFLVTGLQLEAQKYLYDYYLAYARLCTLTGQTEQFLSFTQTL